MENPMCVSFLYTLYHPHQIVRYISSRFFASAKDD
jgi:hypothetical protein